MSTYVVKFMKDVLGQYGRQIEVCQGTLEIDASDENEARERAKAKFCKDQALHHKAKCDRKPGDCCKLPH